MSLSPVLLYGHSQNRPRNPPELRSRIHHRGFFFFFFLQEHISMLAVWEKGPFGEEALPLVAVEILSKHREATSFNWISRQIRLKYLHLCESASLHMQMWEREVVCFHFHNANHGFALDSLGWFPVALKNKIHIWLGKKKEQRSECCKEFLISHSHCCRHTCIATKHTHTHFT